MNKDLLDKYVPFLSLVAQSRYLNRKALTDAYCSITGSKELGNRVLERMLKLGLLRKTNTKIGGSDFMYVLYSVPSNVRKTLQSISVSVEESSVKKNYHDLMTRQVFFEAMKKSCQALGRTVKDRKYTLSFPNRKTDAMHMMNKTFRFGEFEPLSLMEQQELSSTPDALYIENGINSYLEYDNLTESTRILLGKIKAYIDRAKREKDLEHHVVFAFRDGSVKQPKSIVGMNSKQFEKMRGAYIMRQGLNGYETNGFAVWKRLSIFLDKIHLERLEERVKQCENLTIYLCPQEVAADVLGDCLGKSNAAQQIILNGGEKELIERDYSNQFEILKEGESEKTDEKEFVCSVREKESGLSYGVIVIHPYSLDCFSEVERFIHRKEVEREMYGESAQKYKTKELALFSPLLFLGKQYPPPLPIKYVDTEDVRFFYGDPLHSLASFRVAEKVGD